ncbi:MAG TPA: basic amino acid ABC transporter substrate-binding protein [Solirubrobacterales bacterium]|nr:basic amino acid ABC transporter substrate-binding protein [Solirubrobacterales bacterium]
MRKTRLTALLAVFLLAIASLVVAGCGDGDDETTAGGGGGGGEPLTVGSDIPYPPFEQGKEGNYTGYDIELMEAIAEKIGRKAEFQDTSFDTIFRDLAQGRFEAVASATTITDEREETVDFTNPYYFSEQAILVKEGGDKIEDVEELSGLTVGVQQGTTGEEFTEEQADAGEMRSYPQGPDAVNALKSGVLDAVVIDIPVAENAVEAGGVEVSAAIPTEEEYGFVVPQGEEELLDEMNEALEELKDDGTFTTIYEKWFKREPTKALLKATHEPS